MLFRSLGLAPEGRSNSLVNRLRSSFRAGRAVSMPAGECRNPIDAGRLAETIVWLAAHPEAHGLFHVGARDPVSRYELARRLAARMGFAPELVQREHERPDGRAPRGRHHFLKPDRLAALQPLPVPSTDDVIERSIDASA